MPQLPHHAPDCVCVACENDRRQATFEALPKSLKQDPDFQRKVGMHPALGMGYGTRAAEPDNVNSPAHYTAGGIECIDAIRAALTPEEFRGYLKGNVLKYTWRERHKGGEESLRKAEWYLKRLIALGLALGALAGCGSDYCSPFDKPDATVQPVTCSASSPCAE